MLSEILKVVHNVKNGDCTQASPLVRSPAPFLRIMQYLEHITNNVPEMAYLEDDHQGIVLGFASIN